MDLITHIPGIANSALFTPGPNTPSPWNVPIVGATDGNSPASATRNMAEIYNRILFAHDSLIAAAGLPIDHDNWAQLIDALRSAGLIYAAAAGAANAHTVAYTPKVSALVDGMVLLFKAAATNTGATTLNVNGLGAMPVLGGGQSPLQGGEIVTGGRCMVVWLADIASFVLLECTGGALQVAVGTKPNHAAQVSQVAGVVGTARNLRSAVTVASANVNFTADELVVETALGGTRYCIPNFNKVCNLATVGAGGMDVGAVPASGWVAFYALLNPQTGATSIIGVNATAAAAPEVYGGVNMPAGYTASALISVLPTTAAGLLAVSQQRDRTVHYYNSAYSGTGSSTLTMLSMAAAVPKNALSWRGNLAMAPSVNGNISMAVCPTNGGQATPGYVAAQCYSLAGATVGGTVPDTPIFTPQTTYFVTAAAGSFVVNSYGYTF